MAFLLRLVFPGKKLGWVTLRCLMAILAVEILQFITLRGVFDVDHIWMNLLGCLFGYELYTMAARLTDKYGRHVPASSATS